MFGPFEKPRAANPVIAPSPAATLRSPMTDSVVRWEAYATFNPAAVVRNGKVFMLYRAEDATGVTQIGGHTSRLGLAESADGLHFTRRPTPVLQPEHDAQARYEWMGGTEDPRIVETDDGRYVLTYTQWNGDVPRLAVATSTDLLTWRKHGPAFAKAAHGKFLRSETKSGSILCRVAGDHLIATKVNGTALVSPVFVTVTEDVKGAVGARGPAGVVAAMTTFSAANAGTAVKVVAVERSAQRPMTPMSRGDRTDMSAP